MVSPLRLQQQRNPTGNEDALVSAPFATSASSRTFSLLFNRVSPYWLKCIARHQPFFCFFLSSPWEKYWGGRVSPHISKRTAKYIRALSLPQQRTNLDPPRHNMQFAGKRLKNVSWKLELTLLIKCLPALLLAEPYQNWKLSHRPIWSTKHRDLHQT